MKIVRLLALLVGLFLAANTAWMAFTTNFNLGVVLEGLAALAFLAYALIAKLSSLRWLNMAGLVAVILLAAAILSLERSGTTDTADGSEDVLIVLGAALHGREPSPALSARLDVAADFHLANPDALIVVTGGQGPQEELPEAVAAREYLLARGVADDRILVEAASTSTQENLRFARTAYSPHVPADAEVAFVTNEFHVWRAQQIAHQLGLPAKHLHTSTLWYVRPSSYLREVVAACQFLTR